MKVRNLLNVHPSNFRCRFCLEEKPLKGSAMLEGNRYCVRCLRFFGVSKNENARPLMAMQKPEPVERRARGTVKWWDAKRGEWRWVSRKSKPQLKPYEH